MNRETASIVWLFPLTYAIHLAEEYAVAGGFPLWADRALGIQLTIFEFAAWNVCGLALMCIGAWLVARDSKFRFIEIALAVAVLSNVAAHVIGSVMTWTYSPGLITALALWVPLGVFRFRHAYGACGRRARRAGR